MDGIAIHFLSFQIFCVTVLLFQLVSSLVCLYTGIHEGNSVTIIISIMLLKFAIFNLSNREMVEQEPGLKSRIDKPFLLAFLRARKFDYDKAMAMVSIKKEKGCLTFTSLFTINIIFIILNFIILC